MVQTLTMERGPALRAAEEYEKAVKSGRARPGDEDLLAAYRAMASGRAVIDVVAAMNVAGLDTTNRPRLAIARADSKRCYFESWHQCGRFNSDSSYVPDNATSRYVKIPRNTWPTNVQLRDGVAIVPSIPPRHRPQGNLAGYYILWEAEWLPKIPVDPFLLRRLSGNLYIVCAHWDLTPIEQAVLRSQALIS